MFLTLLVRTVLTASTKYLYTNKHTPVDLTTPSYTIPKTITLLQKSTALNCTGVVVNAVTTFEYGESLKVLL